MTRIAKAFCLLAAVGLWQGCSSSSDDADGGKDGSTADTGGSDTAGLFLSRGTNNYEVTAVSGVTDDCDIGASQFVGEVLPVTFTESTQILEVGNQRGTPATASLGEGQVGVTGTLTRDNMTSDGTCTWHSMVTSDFTLTGGDVFTLEVTENQSQFTAACDPIPPGGMCTTKYTITLSKVAATDGGTGG